MSKLNEKPGTLHHRIAQLLAENDRLRAERDDLKSLKETRVAVPITADGERLLTMGFSSSQAVMLEMILDRPLAAHRDLMSAACKPDTGGDGSLRVQLYGIRRKLAPHGIHVHCAWGRGLYMSDDDKAKLRNLMQRGTRL
jgi:hypothetical protein